MKSIKLTILTIALLFAGVSEAQWVQVYNGMGTVTVVSLAYSGNNLFAGTVGNGGGNGVYLSTNNGTNWTQTSLNDQGVTGLGVNGNNIFAGTGDNNIYLSSNNGASWTQSSSNITGVAYSLAANGDNVFAGTFNPISGVYLSTDNGTSWNQTSLNNQYVWSLAVSGNNVFAGTLGSGVYVSTNGGASWMQWNKSLGNDTVYALCIFNNYIFAGTYGNSVYRRPLGELVSIQPISEQIPAHYALEQNYPNPFNPTTKFKIQLSKLSDTRVTVYDVLGREVEILVNQQLKPGTYEVEWNAANVPSGVYFYQLTAGEFSQTNKMILIK